MANSNPTSAATTDRLSGLVTPANIYVLVGQHANGSNFTPGLHTANITLHATDARRATL